MIPHQFRAAIAARLDGPNGQYQVAPWMLVAVFGQLVIAQLESGRLALAIVCVHSSVSA